MSISLWFIQCPVFSNWFHTTENLLHYLQNAHAGVSLAVPSLQVGSNCILEIANWWWEKGSNVPGIACPWGMFQKQGSSQVIWNDLFRCKIWNMRSSLGVTPRSCEVKVVKMSVLSTINIVSIRKWEGSQTREKRLTWSWVSSLKIESFCVLWQ